MEVHLQLILEYLKSGPDKLCRSSRFQNIYGICLCYSGMACRLRDDQVLHDVVAHCFRNFIINSLRQTESE